MTVAVFCSWAGHSSAHLHASAVVGKECGIAGKFCDSESTGKQWS